MKNLNVINAGRALAFAGLLALPAIVRADPPLPFAVSLTGGTLGAGADLIVPLTAGFNFRGGLNLWETSASSFTPIETQYTGKLKLETVPVLIDWYVGGTQFHATAGIVVNNNHENFTAVPGPNGLVLNNDTYTQTQVNSLGGNVNFNRVAPYLGFGYGNALDVKGHWNWSVDIGGIWQGNPIVSYETYGSVVAGAAAANNMFYTDVNREMERLARHFDRMEYYPALSLGVSYKY